MEQKEDTKKWSPQTPWKLQPEDLREFPTWGLPKDLQNYIKAVADGYQCSPSIPTATIFSVAGGFMGKTVKGVFGVYQTYAANWFSLVGKASAGKTVAAEYVYKPVMNYEENVYNDYLAARADYLKQPKDARGEPPRLHSRVEGLMTDERLLHKLAENGGALTWKHGEMEALFGGMGRYAKGGAGMIVGCLEDIFSHTTLQRSTMTGEPIFIREPALNIFTTTQPVKLRQLMAQYVKGRGGFFERFLYVSVSKPKTRKEVAPIADEVDRVWREYVDSLARLEPFTITENEQAADLHKKALEYWQGIGDSLDEYGSEDDFEDVMSSIYYKANYHVCRLAMIAAVLNGETVINAPAMTYAIHCTAYLLANQLAMLQVVIKDDKQREPTKAETIRQLYRLYPGLNKSALASALGISQPLISRVINGG